MNNLKLLCLLVALTLGPCGFNLVAGAAKPNIILIYSDDHGWADLGAQRADQDIRTPNLDALARDGVRFTHGYVSAPQCVPSRAGLITGRYQQKFGVEDNTQGPLPLAELTLAERLKPAGYISCQVGKWHLEPPPNWTGAAREKKSPLGASQFLPLNQGFEEYYTGPMNTFLASHDLSGRQLTNAPQLLTDKRFRCLWQADAALQFIDRHPHDPFFLYLAFFTPHVPLESPEPWFSQTPANLPLERRQALAMIAAMDEGIGKIRAKLRSQGSETNTLIFFIGDNGAPLKAGAWDGSLNLPLIGEKGMLTDGGIRTPFLAAWPGTLPAGRTYAPPVLNLDVAATAVALAGLPPDEKLDGVNLIPFLLGQKPGDPHHALFWRWRSQAAIRAGHWKYILLGENERYLFDLNQPDGESETNNLIASFPDVAADLAKQLLAWNATLPPPGLPRPLVSQDQVFYDAHVNRSAATSSQPTRTPPGTPGDPSQGWIGRECSLAVSNGALRLQPHSRAAKPFITRNNLDLASPVTLVLRLRCPAGGTGECSWRTQGQQDFVAGQKTSFKLSATPDWQEVKADLPASGKIIHVRLAFGKPVLDLAAIEFHSASSSPSFRWAAEPPTAHP